MTIREIKRFIREENNKSLSMIEVAYDLSGNITGYYALVKNTSIAPIPTGDPSLPALPIAITQEIQLEIEGVSSLEEAFNKRASVIEQVRQAKENEQHKQRILKASSDDLKTIDNHNKLVLP